MKSGNPMVAVTDMREGIGMCHHIRATDGEADIGDVIIMMGKNGFAEAGEDNHMPPLK
jgi:hypothetical protein